MDKAHSLTSARSKVRIPINVMGLGLIEAQGRFAL
jgi:hypothetical protein